MATQGPVEPPTEVKAADAPAPPPPPPATAETSDAAPAPQMPGESVAPSEMVMDLPQEEDKSTLAKIRYFIYNPVNGRVLGRTGYSWVKILTFYVLYYFFIFTYFMFWIIVLIQSSGGVEPAHAGSKVAPIILGRANGLTVYPTAPRTTKAQDPKLRIRSSTIYYDMNDPASWTVYKERLAKVINTNYKGYTDQLKTDLGDCIETKNFGYDNGEPCVLIRFNHVFKWKPKAMGLAKDFRKHLDKTYKKDDPNHRSFNAFYGSLPDKFKKSGAFDEFMNNNVGIHCTRDGEDRDALGTLVYYKEPGIPVANFYNPDNDKTPENKGDRWKWTPYVLVQFKNQKRNIFVQVICKAFEENLNLYYSREGVGSVRFSLFIMDDIKPL